MKKAVITSMVGLATVFTAYACHADELVITGTQVKGNAARNAEIISKTVKLVNPARIVKIEGAPEGLCIQSPAEAPLCGSVSELTGNTLKPGNYTAYPNLPMHKERQTVTIHLK